MIGKLTSVLVSLGLVIGFAGSARAVAESIEEGDVAVFRWVAASGPVDHYQVQVASEEAPPFNWSVYGVTEDSAPEISISSGKIPDVHWELEENSGTTASDSTGNVDPGTIRGAAWVEDTPTGSGSALDFDGVNDSVEFSGIDIAGEALTISLWFKADDFDESYGRFISKATGTKSDEHYWMLSTAGGMLRFRLRTDGETTTLIATEGTLEANVWTHAAAVYDGETMRIFKDGVEVGSVAKTGTLSTNAAVATAIGNQPVGAGSNPFDGVIDDVRIYALALSSAQIDDVASGSSGGREWLTVRTVAYDQVGNTGAPSAESNTVHFEPTVDWEYSVANDFDGDSIPDVVTHDAATGEVVVAQSSTGNDVAIATTMGPGWETAAQGDFDADGREDLFWRNPSTGQNRLWLQVGPDLIEETFAGFPEFANKDSNWSILAEGDFDGDGYFDLFWQNAATLRTEVWFMQGIEVESRALPKVRYASWVVEASADFDGSGTHDLLWRDLYDGETAVWLLDGERVQFESSEVSDLDMEIVNLLDQNADGSTDIVWQDTDGSCELWLMSGGSLLSAPVSIGAPECVVE